MPNWRYNELKCMYKMPSETNKMQRYRRIDITDEAVLINLILLPKIAPQFVWFVTFHSAIPSNCSFNQKMLWFSCLCDRTIPIASCYFNLENRMKQHKIPTIVSTPIFPRQAITLQRWTENKNTECSLLQQHVKKLCLLFTSQCKI